MGVFYALYSLSRQKLYGLVGLGFIIISFLYWFLPLGHVSVGLFNILFYFGNILFFDYLSYTLGGKSLLHHKRWKVQLASQLLLVGFFFALLLELYAHWIGKFWYYPYWSFPFYLFILVPGFAFYAFYLTETYLGTKAVIQYFFRKRRRKKESWDKHKNLFIPLGLIGALGIGAVTAYMVLKTTWNIGLDAFLSITNGPFPGEISFYLFLLAAIFLWFFLEYLEFERHETSMLYEMIHGNFTPIAAVFISAWISAILYEIFNIPRRTLEICQHPFISYTDHGNPTSDFFRLAFPLFPSLLTLENSFQGGHRRDVEIRLRWFMSNKYS